MSEECLAYGDNNKLHDIEKIAKFHLDFEGIHPFIDGNGRTGRLVLKLELMQEIYLSTKGVKSSYDVFIALSRYTVLTLYIQLSILYLKGVINMAQINIRIDDNLKEQAEILFEELGLITSTAFNVFIRQSIRQDR